VPSASETEWWWLRHAPARTGGGLMGRRDPDLAESRPAGLATLASRLPADAVVLSSPLRRCRQTLAALRRAGVPLGEEEVVPAFQEQDFGDWEGRPAAELAWPEAAGPAEMAEFSPPGGESFNHMAARVAAAIARLTERHRGRRVLVCAHAGSVRAALALALGGPAGHGLVFDVRPLSLTRLTAFAGLGWRIDAVNVDPAEDPRVRAA